jgi:hypothetical protein
VGSDCSCVHTLDAHTQSDRVVPVNSWRTQLKRDMSNARYRQQSSIFLYETAEGMEEDKAAESFFQGSLCIDSRKLGNVAAFIRNTSKVPDAVRNLIKVLVYDRSNAGAFPRLALFAARDISANSELFM